MRFFISFKNFKPASCKNISLIILAGNKYKILNSKKRVYDGIWILAKTINNIKYDVFLTEEEIKLGLIEN